MPTARNAFEAEILGGLSLTAFDRRRSGTEDGRWSLLSAAAFAAFCHAVLIAIALLHLRDTLGLESGSLDGLAVEIVDAATLDRMSSSSAAGASAIDTASRPGAAGARQAAPAEPSAQAAAEATPQPSSQAAARAGDNASPQPQQPAQAQSRQTTNQPPPKSKEQPVRQAKKEPGLSAPEVLATPLESSLQVPKAGILDLDAKLPTVGKAASAPRPQASAVSPLEKFIERQNRQSGAAAYGQIDEFKRAIHRIAEANRPAWTGAPASAILEFVLTQNGEVEAVRIVQSSGHADLDRMLAQAIRRTRYISPPSHFSPDDRTIEITYKYN